MLLEFKITDVGFMSYYLGLEMLDCNLIKTPMECRVKLLKFDDRIKEYPTLFKSLVGSLRYLTCIRLNILFLVGVVSRYMEAPTSAHMKAAKRILCYLKGTIEFGLFYSFSHDFQLMGFCDSDFASDIDDRKNTFGFMFFLEIVASLGVLRNNPL
ncbi:hypothetical protein ES288_D08G067500v1 [Gossypium darwinii]|uniref:Reverse transcriptase Ty1/copia-type domain-containing protein n=1 Tax=Gossypium darwinii TaxID=34276 RepID=A0A5D2BJK7_GOSDA|nr:hypothetical protein ES288_D08G067500v1 [Gossypium darwinii]